MSSLILVSVVLLLFCWKIQSLPTFRGGLNRADGLCVKLVHPYGYRCEELAVETKDGFLLGVQRMSSASYFGPRKKPVFLNHGILIVFEADASILFNCLSIQQGGDIWVLNSPAESLAFILADAGHDVWIANVRTSEFSYGHISHNKVDREFWDWSVDELSAYDLQAMLEMVHARTGTKILYVGYSQGTQAAFAAFSEHRLVDIVEKAVMLAPVAYVDHATSLLTLGAQTHLDLLLASLGINEFSLRAENKPVTEYFCKLSDDPECTENFVTLLAGQNCCINDTRREFYEIYEPQSTSAKNFGHLAQQYRGKSFCKFDYGFWQNMLRYGWISPPSYPLSNIPGNIPFLFFYAAKDALAAPRNVAQLVSELQSKPELVFLPDYAHLDFVVSWNAKDLVYPKVLEFFA